MIKPTIQPRTLRFTEAPAYLGMCRDEFNKTVRPHVREFPIGKRGVGFDRHDLDAWADGYIAGNAISKQQRQPVTNVKASHHPRCNHSKTKRLDLVDLERTESEFQRALELVTGKKRK